MTDSSLIPTKIQMELNVVLSVFFKDTTKFSTIYWPHSIRTFLANLLNDACINYAGFDTYLTVPKNKIPQLVSVLREPTSTYICVADRRDIGNILRSVQVHHRTCGFKQKLPEATAPVVEESLSTSEPSWPVDLCSYQDLSASVLKRTIRRDVTNFVHFLVRRCVGSAGYKVSYNVPDKDPDQKEFAPIVVHVHDPAKVAELRQLIVNESQTEGMQSHKNLTPQDLISVISTGQRFQPLLEEGYLMSGGPYRVGTLGAVITKEGTLLGLTSHHVANCISAVKTFEVIGNSKVPMVNDELDFCLF